MQHYDVIVVGGGPAGATCARHLVERGARVAVVDRSVFPRDKVCAGWITPQVIHDVKLDVDDYRRGRVFQWLTDFRVGSVGAARAVPVHFDGPVSGAIRRCEFDAYLLERSGAERHCGVAVQSIVRKDQRWVVNHQWTAAIVVGAAGWGCPVGRLLNGNAEQSSPAIVAKEAEYVLAERSRASCAVAPGTAEIYFTEDLLGYGWCVRKGDVMNVGLGRLGRRLSRGEIVSFGSFVQATRGVDPPDIDVWRGHAYLAGATRTLRRTGDGLILIGDAAGLASDRSGEGIGPAVQSAILAASVIAEAVTTGEIGRLARYDAMVSERWQRHSALDKVVSVVPAAVARPLVAPLLRTRTFVAGVVLNRWFLHAHEPLGQAA
jgi:flavin-dependent dehydrogenase